MTEKIKLVALSRDKNKNNVDQNYVSAEVYGPGVENQHIFVNEVLFQKVFEQAKVSTLLDLQIDDKPAIQVIIREVQKNPINEKLTHVDFYQVDKSRKVTTKVSLVNVNSSFAIQNLGGILVKNLSNLTIEALPDDLVSYIEVDLSKLKNLKDKIRVEDIDVPAKIKIKNNPRDIVMSVVSARKKKVVSEVNNVEEVKETDKQVGDEGKTEKQTPKSEDGEKENK